jgi:hypothetical protein
MSFLGLSLLQWTALATIAAFLVVATAIAAILVNSRTARADRQRDDERRAADRQWDSDRRKEDRDHDAELRRQEREREDRLRREEDEKWERRRREERRQREDDDAQQQVVVEFRQTRLLSQSPPTGMAGDGITHQIVVTTSAAYPIKWIDARIAHRANSGLGILPPGWTFDRPVTDGGQVRYTCSARVPEQAPDAAPIVRFADRNGNLYYSYLGYTRRFSQNTDWGGAAAQLDEWIRTGPKPDEPVF